MSRRIFNRAGGIAGGRIGGKPGAVYMPPMVRDDGPYPWGTYSLRDMDAETRAAFRDVYGFAPRPKS